MLRPDSASRRDMVTDNAMAVIAAGGMAALTLKAMSERIGYSPQAIHQWYGTRDELVVVVGATFCQRWTQWVWRRAYECALLALLPAEEHEVPWTRVLLAIEEQARVQTDLGPMLAGLRESERQLMMRLHPCLVGEAGEGSDAGEDCDAGDQLSIITLVVAGLRAALCRVDDPTTVGDAQKTLLDVQARLAGPLDDWVSRAAPGGGSSLVD